MHTYTYKHICIFLVYICVCMCVLGNDKFLTMNSGKEDRNILVIFK